MGLKGRAKETIAVLRRANRGHISRQEAIQAAALGVGVAAAVVSIRVTSADPSMGNILFTSAIESADYFALCRAGKNLRRRRDHGISTIIRQSRRPRQGPRRSS